MSNMEADCDRITITHYMNPHMFWFKYESSSFMNTDLFAWENQLQTHFFKLSRSPPTAYQPKIDEVVAAFIFSLHRWIRARCDFISSAGSTRKYHVWAIDYGTPFQVEDRFIRQLPPDLDEGPRELVFFAGLMNIVPAQKSYNLQKLEPEMVACDKWSAVAISTIQKLIKEADGIRFARSKRSKDGQFFGNLLLTTQTKKTVKADEILLAMDQAKSVNAHEFFKILDNIGTNRVPRWLSSADETPTDLKTNSKKCITPDDKLKYEVETISPMKLMPGISDSEIDAERKCLDWEKRNEKYRLEGEISLDDISFNDSVSVRHLKEERERDERILKLESDDDDDPPVMLKAGVLRRQYLSKYKDTNSIPPPPSEKNDSSKNDDSSKGKSSTVSGQQNDNQGSSKCEYEMLEAETKSTSTDKSNLNSSARKLINTSTEKSPSNEDCSNAVNLVMSRLASKRKSLQAKALNQNLKECGRNDTEKQENKISAPIREAFVENQSSTKNNETTINDPKPDGSNKSSGSGSQNSMKNDAIQNEKPMESRTSRYDRKLDPRHVIPAGFDMRNLGNNRWKANQGRKSNSPKEENKTSNRSLNERTPFTKNSNSDKSQTAIGETQKLSPQGMNTAAVPVVVEEVASESKPAQKFVTRNKRTYKEANKICLNQLEEQCLQTNLSKHLVLVHGKHIARPIEKLANANFCDEVHRELEDMRLTQIYRIQSYTWPHIMRGNSSVVVSSARTGRTMSYLPAICSLIKMESDEGLVPDSVGPIGIIIAPSSIEVERISKLSRRFLHGSPTKIAIVESYGIRNIEKTTRYLLNGCEALVATPPSLIRLIKNQLKLFDSKRLRHLVIDNIDFMQEEMKSELHEILRFCCGSKATMSVQLVVIAKYWSPIISGFIKMGHNTQLCIGAYIEGAVYGRSLINMKFIKRKSKANEVIDFIRDHPYLSERLIIVCNKDEEVEEIVDALKSNSCFFVACCSRSTAEEIELSKEWHRRPVGDLSVLVCTDDVLPELKVSEAQNIIHYSLPQSWTRFSFRFSTQFGYFDDFLKSNVPLKTPPACLILLDENNNAQLPRLIHFLNLHNVENIPKEIYALCNKIQIQREEERVSENREFCRYVLEFGKCLNSDDCPFRHELTKYDIPEDIRLVSGNIIFKVLNVVSPIHYTVRLLEHQQEGSEKWNKIRKSNEYLKFNLQLAQYFSNPDNHQLHWPIEVGDLCIVSEGDAYHRAKVLFVTKSKSTNLITDVACRVKLVDTGRTIACKSSRVLHLPDQFQTFPNQAINLRLSGVVPCDHEQDWSSNAVETVRHWFRKYATDNIKVVGKIKFSLMDTIWVENIKLIEELECIKTYVTTVNIKMSLLEKQFAVVNHDAEEILKEKATACGIFKSGFLCDVEREANLETSEERKSDSVTMSLYERSGSVCSSVSSQILREEVSKSFFESELEKSGSKLSKKSDSMGSNKILKHQNICTNKLKKLNMTQHSERNKPKSEAWTKLEENKFCRVLVGAFYNPNNFYIQKLTDLDSKEELYRSIDKFAEQNPVVVTDPKIGLNCLAKYENKYNRAKIMKVLCDGENSSELMVSVFFCDIGISDKVKLSEVLHSNEKLMKLIPFQAIRCKMCGIVPTTYGIWTEDTCDRIYDDIIDPAQFLYARAVKEEEPSGANDLEYWRYEVVLLDCTTETDVNINEKIVEMGLAKYNPQDRHYLSIAVNLPPPDSDDDSDSVGSNWDNCNYVNPKFVNYNPDSGIDDLVNLDLDVDIQFTQDDILQLLNLPPTAKILPPVPPRQFKELNTITEILDENANNKSPSEKLENDRILQYYKNREQSKIMNTPSSGSSSSDRIQYKSMPRLKTLHKSPQVYWQQSESLISLQIAAVDVTDYYLKVTSTNLLFIANIENETKIIALNFCGCINASLVSHEIRGLKIYVRLPKAVKGLIWPRLTFDSDKPSWLKYNYDSIIVEQETLLNTGRYGSGGTMLDISSDTDSYSDEDDFIGQHDDFDPFDDEFLYT